MSTIPSIAGLSKLPPFVGASQEDLLAFAASILARLYAAQVDGMDGIDKAITTAAAIGRQVVQVQEALALPADTAAPAIVADKADADAYAARVDATEAQAKADAEAAAKATAEVQEARGRSRAAYDAAKAAGASESEASANATAAFFNQPLPWSPPPAVDAAAAEPASNPESAPQ